MKIKSRLLFCFTSLVLVFTGIWLYLAFVPVVAESEGIVYYVKPGVTKKVLLTDLGDKNILPFPKLLAIFIFPQKSAQIKTGEYKFPYGATSFAIWKQITTGTGLYFHHFTIIPGWSFNQLRYELLREPSLKHHISGLNDKQIMEYLSDSRSLPEGLFYPDTYSYTRGVSDLSILKIAYQLMQKKLKLAWDHRDSQLPYRDEYEALVAASLIEKEAYLNAERPVIAGVLVNRLHNNMLLQFDPSVIYGLGQKYDGKIHKQNLSDQSIYNTYVHKGLPPTPIAIPSQSSIEAALHPQKHDYYYFVATGDGSHHFSKSLIEHTRTIADINKSPGFFNGAKVQGYIQQTLMKKIFQKVSYDNTR